MPTRHELIAFTATASALAAFAWRPRARTVARDLFPVADGATGLLLLKLPPDFSYVSYGWRRDPIDDGNGVPGLHDGMGAFVQDDDRTVVLVRNHEFALAPLNGAAAIYDQRCGFQGDFRDAEWCGVCHAGDWVFANIQITGITFAITDPWDDLAKR